MLSPGLNAVEDGGRNPAGTALASCRAGGPCCAGLPPDRTLESIRPCDRAPFQVEVNGAASNREAKLASSTW